MTTPTLTPAGEATPGPSSRPAPQVGTSTPGPWSATRSDPSRGADVWNITACPAPNQEKDICDVPGGPHQEANARLIAAAPAMRDALEDLVVAIRYGWDLAQYTTAARTALALAHGAAPAGGADPEEKL